jgi:hypothetical protein
MRGLKTWLACAVVGAVMVSVAAGAGSASAATELSKGVLPCAAGYYSSNSGFTTNRELALNPITGCEFIYEWETLSALASPLPAEITGTSISHCGTGYTVTAVSLPWKYQLAVTASGPEGVGKITGTKLSPGFKVSGHGESNCFYEATTIPQWIQERGFVDSSMVTLTNVPMSGSSGCITSVELSMSGPTSPEYWISS